VSVGMAFEVVDLPDILYGPVLEELSALLEAEETVRIRIFYKMVEEILALKEEEERVR